ncbi:MAG TPA: HAMP domain-containing sensor histidine kinase [Streptosporangiaceae bacterium]|nr:HAMP domain-containing sensor histidine kinase [Streptosporangiaceae bacterium]
MKLPRPRLPPQFAHAARVAAIATLVIAVVYMGCVTALDLMVASRLTGQTDARLDDRLAEASRYALLTMEHKDSDDDDDIDVAPVFLWLVDTNGHSQQLSAGAPALPRSLRPGHGWPVSAVIGGSAFRLEAKRTGGQWFVAGESVSENTHTEQVLLDSEIVAAPLLLLAMFLGSLTVGIKAMAPVEQSRQRQLEFTADASHELRTPLSVISAEADIALTTPRKAAEYQGSLARIQGESKRLGRIVEDLLWLARFDSRPPPPGNEPLDVATIADSCADRFRPVARSRSITITTATGRSMPALISAPPEWIDRLAGVLMDNACRYAGQAGHVRVTVTTAAGKVSLAVEDSGPGIPEKERPRLFDRFHRATDQGQGAGLGLAIADSIVRSTGGRWHVGDSAALGGARMEVSWRRHQPRLLQPGARRPASQSRDTHAGR